MQSTLACAQSTSTFCLDVLCLRRLLHILQEMYFFWFLQARADLLPQLCRHHMAFVPLGGMAAGDRPPTEQASIWVTQQTQCATGNKYWSLGQPTLENFLTREMEVKEEKESDSSSTWIPLLPGGAAYLYPNTTPQKACMYHKSHVLHYSTFSKHIKGVCREIKICSPLVSWKFSLLIENLTQK